MPLFSTILTSFNRPHTLKNAVNSVIHNTVTDWELIIGDSSNNDKDRIIIEDYCKSLEEKDSRIKFKQFEKFTKADTERKCEFAYKINELFKLTSGKYITYLCDDDLYSKNYYQAYLDVYETHPEADVVYTGQNAFATDLTGGNNHEFRYRLPAEHIKRNMFFTVDHNCVSHKREVFDKVGGWDDSPWLKGFADAEFWAKLAFAGYLAYPTHRITSIKSVHIKNITHGYNGNGDGENIVEFNSEPENIIFRNQAI